MQTEDYRLGMIEGVLSCHLAGVIDTDEFWYTIDNVIYADHNRVLKRLNLFDFLEPEVFMALFEAMPKMGSEKIKIEIAEIDALPNELTEEDYEALNKEILQARLSAS